MLYKSSSTGNRIMTVAAVIAVTAIALTACGDSNEDAPVAAPSPTAAPAPTATSVPERPTPAPPEQLVMSATVPEPGSDEALLLAVLEKQLEAVNDENFDLFVETCAPSGRNQLTEGQVEYVFEGVWGEGKTKPHGYNVREVEVKLLRAPFAQVEFDFFYYDEYFGSVFWTFEKVDDDWYMEVYPCR